MSAFLGPIHDWLYHKIRIQEKIVEGILNLNQEKDYVQGLENAVILHCGMVESGPLEQRIDTGNIHGWLQEQIEIVEKRLSYVVTAMTKEDASNLHEILEIVYQIGEEVMESQEEKMDITSAEQAYQLLNDLLLDGMPCDRINQVISSSKEEVVFQQTRCTHEVYWLEQGGLVMYYYDIRRKFVEGLLAKTPFEFYAEEDGNYHIRRREGCLE